MNIYLFIASLFIAIPVHASSSVKEHVTSQAQLNEMLLQAMKKKTTTAAQIEDLIRQGALVTATDAEGYMPLELAIKKNRADLVNALIEGGASVHKREGFAWSPLMLAAYYNCPDACKALLIHGASILDFSTESTNKSMQRRLTALHIAAEQGHKEVTEVLLKAGSDPFLEVGSLSPVNFCLQCLTEAPRVNQHDHVIIQKIIRTLDCMLQYAFVVPQNEIRAISKDTFDKIRNNEHIPSALHSLVADTIKDETMVLVRAYLVRRNEIAEVHGIASHTEVWYQDAIYNHAIQRLRKPPIIHPSLPSKVSHVSIVQHMYYGIPAALILAVVYRYTQKNRPIQSALNIASQKDITKQPSEEVLA